MALEQSELSVAGEQKSVTQEIIRLLHPTSPTIILAGNLIYHSFIVNLLYHTFTLAAMANLNTNLYSEPSTTAISQRFLFS